MISNADINEHALFVVEKLQQAGFEAYLVGGCVRDLLLKLKPKDFDVATNAHPNQVRALFRNSRLIGQRFRLVHVYFDRREVIEVATFRAHHETPESENTHQTGLILRDNVYGSLEEDAWRRDFTINAFYYDPIHNQIVDYVKGTQDLQSRLLRIIGDPEKRYREDPVRMLRVIRFAAKLNFSIEAKTAAPIAQFAHLLELISPARLFDEVTKLFYNGKAFEVFHLLLKYQLFHKLFPLTRVDEPTRLKFIELMLRDTDKRIQAGKTVTPAFLCAVMLWHNVLKKAQSIQSEEVSLLAAFEEAGQDLLKKQQEFLSMPRHISLAIREIWNLQPRLENQHLKKRALSTLQLPRFRAAYDLLLLRSRIGEVSKEIADWWTELQIPEGPKNLGLEVQKAAAPKKRKRRPFRSKKKTDS